MRIYVKKEGKYYTITIKNIRKDSDCYVRDGLSYDQFHKILDLIFYCTNEVD